jgi:hypothetical protein
MFQSSKWNFLWRFRPYYGIGQNHKNWMSDSIIFKIFHDIPVRVIHDFFRSMTENWPGVNLHQTNRCCTFINISYAILLYTSYFWISELLFIRFFLRHFEWLFEPNGSNLFVLFLAYYFLRSLIGSRKWELVSDFWKQQNPVLKSNTPKQIPAFWPAIFVYLRLNRNTNLFNP